MKKKIFVLMILFGLSIGLTACIPLENTDQDAISTTYTEDELKELISELLPEVEAHTSYDLTTFQDDVTEMIAQSRNGVVGLEITGVGVSGTGSGVIYKKVDDTYYVVTNHHVVEDAVSIRIVYEERDVLFVNTNNVTLVGSDPTTDLAVVTFESTELFHVMEFADSDELEIGQFVFAIGNPLGFEYYGTVTMGVVSGLTRFISDETTGFNATLLQHDAAINPGNSGGALLDIDGKLIGINNLKLDSEEVANIGFAIPANTVIRIVTDLEDDGEITRPYLGVTAVDSNQCDDVFGVCVTVQSGGAAEAAELEDYDVIVGYKRDGMDDYIEINNFNELKEAILNSSVGETIQLKYYRNGIIYESKTATLKVHPDDK